MTSQFHNRKKYIITTAEAGFRAIDWYTAAPGGGKAVVRK
jgi:hypothetical protein